MRLTTPERRTLRLALNLAIAWEDALLDSNTACPDDKKYPEEKERDRRCKRNIAKFERLRDKIDAATR